MACATVERRTLVLEPAHPRVIEARDCRANKLEFIQHATKMLLEEVLLLNPIYFNIDWWRDGTRMSFDFSVAVGKGFALRSGRKSARRGIHCFQPALRKSRPGLYQFRGGDASQQKHLSELHSIAVSEPATRKSLVQQIFHLRPGQ